MIQVIDDSTPIAMLTVGQLKKVLETPNTEVKASIVDKPEKQYVYGIAGIARLFACSIPTANRIKASGKIDKALKQIGRKIVVDAELALELAGRKNGGR